jgi:hypothetical protein
MYPSDSARPTDGAHRHWLSVWISGRNENVASVLESFEAFENGPSPGARLRSDHSPPPPRRPANNAPAPAAGPTAFMRGVRHGAGGWPPEVGRAGAA